MNRLNAHKLQPSGFCSLQVSWRGLHTFCIAMLIMTAPLSDARADRPAAPLQTPTDMVVSFLTAGTTQVAPATLFAETNKKGMLLYDSNANALKYCDGTGWLTLADSNALGSGPMGPAGYIQLSDGAGGFMTSGTASGQQFYWNNTNHRLGIGTTSPQYSIDVAGDMRIQASNSLRFTNAISILADTTFNGSNGIAIRIGKSATTATNDSIAIGTNTNAAGAGVAIGGVASVSGSGSGVAIGLGASALSSGVAVGGNAVASGDGSGIAIGPSSRATSGSVALGLAAGSSTFSGIAMGRESVLTGNNQFVAGGVGGNALTITNVFFGNGPKSTAPLSYTINGSGADGTDIAGGHLSLAGGRNTGAGTPGDVRILTATVGSSGTVQQALATRLTVKGGTGNVGIGTATPSSSAALEVASTASGFLPPRMTTAQRDAIVAPVAGLIIFNTTSNTLNFYDGSAWSSFFSQSINPVSFSFIDQSGVPINTTISSNAVTLTGFPGTLTATCTNCTAIARNGVWGGTTVSGFASGDTIAIRVLSSSTYGAAVTANATVGGTVSGTWTVQSVANDGPLPFSFTDVSGATVGITYTSNTVTLSGFTGTLTATCNDCTGIARNGTWGISPMPGFVSGNTITLRRASSAGAGNVVTASVTLGSTTSSPWTITTANGCAVGITIGQECPDGTIFAGFTPDGNVPMYTTRCDAGQTWDGSACTGTRLTRKWNNTVINGSTAVSGFTSSITGLANTAGLAALVDIVAPYHAAVYCDGLTAHGKSDWYLPAANELAIFYANRSAIGGFDGTGTQWYWSSSEMTGGQGNAFAWSQRFSDGSAGQNSKFATYFLRCARR